MQHEGAGRFSDSSADNHHFSITANSMFSFRLLCLPGASHRPRAQSSCLGGTAVVQRASLLSAVATASGSVWTLDLAGEVQ